MTVKHSYKFQKKEWMSRNVLYMQDITLYLLPPYLIVFNKPTEQTWAFDPRHRVSEFSDEVRAAVRDGPLKWEDQI